MKRRIAIRMRTCRCTSAAEYCNLLRQSNSEIELLKKNLTIHVSQFFRNPSMFEKLRTQVLPVLFSEAAQGKRQLRLASLGSAGGEEAYSMAMILNCFFAGEFSTVAADILAIDIDADILNTARAGEYGEDRLKDLPGALRERYFHRSGSRFQVSEEIRRMVSFRQQDIMSVSSLAPCNLVLCRNTLIYFTRPDQEIILHGIADILPSGGILVLGKSETLVGDVRKFFTSVCPVERIYRKV